MAEMHATYADAQRDIQTRFVDKVLDFLRGDSQKVTTNKEFVNVYNIVLYQCDQEDNNNHLY